uniref:DNA cross-link repair 1A protein n=1 Tax=Reticulitermes speratus TaxID=60591 RepID=A0A2Z5TTX0_9NEOP
MKSGVHKCDLHESYAGNGHTGTVNCMTGDTNLKTCTSDKRNDEIRLRKINSTFSGKQGTLPNGKISKALKFSAENVKSAEFKGSKSNILTACEKNEGKFEEKTCAGGCNSECNHELKLRAIVKYTTDKLENSCGDNRNIRTRVLPCKMESDSECLNTVRATMSLVLSPCKENSRDGEDKIKTPVKVDASCSEAGWETIGIAALPGTEVHDVTLSLCKCAKTMQINCSLSHNHTVTNFTDKMDMKPRELESKFFSSVKELGLSHKSCENEAVEIPHHQMSVTSYFRSSRQSSSRTQNILTKNVKSTSSSFAVPQDSHCLKSCNLNTTLKERYEPSSKVPKQNKESVVAYWKERLDGMRQRGLSAMSVMSDDTLTIASDGHTSASNSDKSQKFVRKKTCPSYKRIPDTSFVVDAFQYGIIPGISHYFLSHFHSDHYGGLSRSFSKPIYCSKITAALVKMKLLVDEKHLHVLDTDVPQKINGVLVTALEANHCPGSVMFLFQLQDGRNHLHVGDFRADPKMESYPCFWNLTIDKLFLDTTYCEPRYTFPVQSETVQRVVELAVEHNRRAPSTLFVCGTYTLGKENVFLGIVEALNCKLWANDGKRKVLECLDNQIINERLTNRQWAAQVHVCRMSDLNISFLQSYLKHHEGIYTHIVAFIPTGWEMSRKSKTLDIVNTVSRGNITIYGVPYSEHSSFTELRRFVQFLRPIEIIPTVNAADPTKRNAMTEYFKRWLSEASLSPRKRKAEGDQYVQQKITRYMKP